MSAQTIAPFLQRGDLCLEFRSGSVLRFEVLQLLVLNVEQSLLKLARIGTPDSVKFLLSRVAATLHHTMWPVNRNQVAGRLSLVGNHKLDLISHDKQLFVLSLLICDLRDK